MIKRLLHFILLLTICVSAYSQATGLTDLKFGRYQIADSQWNVSACMYTNTCEIYSKNPGTAYKIPWTSGQLTWSAGDYVAFVKTGDPTNPWNAIQYNADGTQKAIMGTGHIINMSADYFFFVGNDNNTGQLFSMTSGFSDTSGVTWTGTLNPTIAQVDSYAAGGSTTPLAAGQTVSPAPSANTVIGTSNGITTNQQTRVDIWTNKNLISNEIYIDQIGDNNTVNITQTGNKNSLVGIGQQRAKIDGDNNSLTVNQGVSGAGQNQIQLSLLGNNNTLSLAQSRDNTGTAVGTNGHYQSVDMQGDYNSLTTRQTNAGGVGGHYMETTIVGNTNTVNNQQLDNGNKIMFSTINGNNNSISAIQKDSGQHYLDVKLTGNGNSATVVQEGTSANRATIDLTNTGGPNSLTLNQTGGNSFSITQSCPTPSGCALTVRQ